MTISISKLTRRLGSLAAIGLLAAAMGGSWSTASAAPSAVVVPAAAGTAGATGATAKKSNHKELSGKLNLNTATEDQLMLLPSIGPSKAERVVAWRKKNGGFKRTADLRRVKGFGYKTFKRLEPYLDIKGDTTLVAQ
ncbi:MAG TPA: helix-hairpin-helix domain-containing protein [Kofleriaceae bacterium]|jgi:competence protein ComEA